MRRSFSMLVSLVLLALVAYNTAQVISLKHEVASLKKQVAAAESGHGKSSGNTSAIGKAQKHIDLAKQYALKGDFKRADKELNTGLNLLQKAGRDTTQPYTDRMDSAERTLRETQGIIQRLLGNTEKASGKGKGG
jgi:hypothetical protein